MMNQIHRMHGFCRSIALLLLLSGSLIACQVPVFRYALERWEADQYQMVVLHKDSLTTEQQAIVKRLQSQSSELDKGANFQLQVTDVAKVKDRALLDLWSEHDESAGPLAVVLYPKTAREVPDRIAYTAPLDQLDADNVASSPVREQVAKHLLAGESAVWIFVPSGDREQDQAAMERLSSEVLINEKTLELPEQEEPTTEEDILKATGIELRIGFKVVTLDRNDPKEQVLLRLLMESEPDLMDLDQPMAFPVLGRGRVLYALVGRGIATETIGGACRFMVGPCSCQVKNQNPGFDLLMACDWDGQIAGKELSDPVEPVGKKPVLLTIPSGKRK